LSKADTATAKLFPEVWAKIAPKIQGLPLVAHNSPFDEGCLRANYALYEMEYPEYQFFCTLRKARQVFPNLPNHQLHTVAAHCGFDLTQHHHALADAEACAAIALKVF
jgi:DNA polymerase-3 subunit epsilon